MALQENTSLNESPDLQKKINADLDGLVYKVGEKYGIPKARFAELATIQTRGDIVALKEELNNLPINNENDRKIIEKFYLSDNKEGEKVSVSSIDTTTQQTIVYTPAGTTFENMLPNEMLEACQNPTKPHEHIMGGVVGLASSCVEAVKIVGVGCIDAVKLPRDVYLVMSGRAVTDDFQNT